MLFFGITGYFMGKNVQNERINCTECEKCCSKGEFHTLYSIFLGLYIYIAKKGLSLQRHYREMTSNNNN